MKFNTFEEFSKNGNIQVLKHKTKSEWIDVLFETCGKLVLKDGKLININEVNDYDLVREEKVFKTRGFEIVEDKFRKNPNAEIKMPVRKTKNSAAYDISSPISIKILPNEKVIIMSDVKSYMMEDEVLELHVRSSLGIKKGIILQNCTGIIDSDYYSNKDNDGNIGLALWNTSDKEVEILQGECVCQGIFKKYLISDNGNSNSVRVGGIGSTNN